jgi:peptidoglycan/xylan/chitin deacetylase (PgdA/CDA1 family)
MLTHGATRVLLTAVWLSACTEDQLGLEIEAHEREVLTSGQLNGNALPARTVVLTYDDGPDEHTLELARYLNENGVRATFFVNGRRFCKTVDAEGKCTSAPDTRPCNNGQSQAGVAMPKYYPESLLDELVALGHRIGNHTQDHCHLGAQSNVADLIWEVKTTQDILDRHICDDIFLFRAPYGEWSGTVATRANSMMNFAKITGPVNWDVDGQDWDCWRKGTSPEACANGYISILNRRGNQNGIFLMHDRPEFNVGSDAPLRMTKVLVPRLKQAGFRFGTIEEALRLTARDGGTGCPMAPARDGGSITPGSPDGGAEADAAGTGPADAAAGTGGTGGGGGNGDVGSRPDAGTGGRGGRGGSGGAGGAATAGSGGEDETGGAGAPGGRSAGADGGGCAMARGSRPAPAFVLSLLIGAAWLRLRRARRAR